LYGAKYEVTLKENLSQYPFPPKVSYQKMILKQDLTFFKVKLYSEEASKI